MGRRTQSDPTFKPVRSYYRNLASNDCKVVMDAAKENFIKNYMTFKKNQGCCLTECNSEDFHSFIVNVNGFYKSRMKQLRHNYLGYTEVKNVLYDMSQHS